ncbi:hypothetical protein IQ62_00225 [Streptomyces scabiei]|uniref:hypothetical protein n=1 Tax=Streptomyces scabiei TaxID=1930 RepID=UPI0004E6F59F|nr:hypothetical protein [Streptomyces scabiei]KFG02743.1 hypothetical protein IQ62_00225 [Streptomyces scabiei]
MSEPVRWVIPAILLLAVAGIPLSLLWEKVRPSSYTRRPREGTGELASWRRLPTYEQAALDREVLDAAEDAARVAVERSAEINVLYRP